MRKNTNLPLNRQEVEIIVLKEGKQLKTIFRATNREKYSWISDFTLKDSRLSFKARGLLSYLLSKPDDWILKLMNKDRFLYGLILL